MSAPHLGQCAENDISSTVKLLLELKHVFWKTKVNMTTEAEIGPGESHPPNPTQESFYNKVLPARRATTCYRLSSIRVNVKNQDL